jgi:hypothetical protein
MAKKLTSGRRDLVAEKMMEWGNLVFTGLVIAQFVPGPLSDLSLVVAGIVSLAAAYSIAIRVMRGGGSR